MPGGATEAKPPTCAQPASHRRGVKGVIMQALTIALLTRHNDIPATESPAPKSPACESVTASGADTVFTHAASAVCRHHNDADQMRTAAFAHLTCANAPLFPPCKHNYMAECARFLPLRIRPLLWSANINHALESYLHRYGRVACDKKTNRTPRS